MRTAAQIGVRCRLECESALTGPCRSCVSDAGRACLRRPLRPRRTAGNRRTAARIRSKAPFQTWHRDCTMQGQLNHTLNCLKRGGGSNEIRLRFTAFRGRNGRPKRHSWRSFGTIHQTRAAQAEKEAIDRQRTCCPSCRQGGKPLSRTAGSRRPTHHRSRPQRLDRAVQRRHREALRIPARRIARAVRSKC